MIRKVSGTWASGIVAAALKYEKKKSITVSVLLTDNRGIRKINKRFLKHDYATDVIAFNYGEMADIVVSVEMAKKVAKELGISFKEELARYLIHGVLHILGYDDKSFAKRKIMHARQEEILKVML